MISIKVLIQLPVKTIEVLALAIMEAGLSLSICISGLCSISLAFNFNDTVPHILFFSLVNSYLHRKISVCFTCGFEFCWGAQTLRSQAKYNSHVHRCQHEVIPVVLMGFIQLHTQYVNRKQTHVCVHCKKTKAFTFLTVLKLKFLKSNVHFWVYDFFFFFPNSFILRSFHFQVWRWTISSCRCGIW